MGHFSYQQPEKAQLSDHVFALRSDHVRFWYYQQLLDSKVNVNTEQCSEYDNTIMT